MILSVFKKYHLLLILFLVFFAFSNLIFFYTFYVDSSGNINIGSKLWSDFGSTFPLIRSFSKGYNFPPEYPIFAGSPIRYHFGFYAAVGILEKLGVRIDIALNTLSSLSFAAMLCLIFFLAFSIFKKYTVSTIAVLLSLFNGSLGFINYFENNHLSFNTPLDVLRNNNFAAFGPYNGDVVSAFWNLNIYTNQRHLALAYAVFIGILFFLHYASKEKDRLTLNKTMVIGLVIGLFPFIHMAVFGMLLVLLATSFIVYPKLRLKLCIAGLVALTVAFPMIVYMGPSQVKTDLIHLGYLAQPPSILNFLKYWFMNLGLNTILPFVGFLLAKRDQRKIFVPFLLLFVIGNVFRFSVEIAANHKFFNLFLVGASIFTAYSLNRIWHIKILGKIMVPVLLIMLTLSGIIDFFPILNDTHLKLRDVENNEAAKFIMHNTRSDSVILNSKFLYDPASIAGRKIYIGWPYFAWSAGYDTEKRFKKLGKIMNVADKSTLCRLLMEERIDYLEVENPSEFANEGIVINYKFFENNLQPIFKLDSPNISIYKTAEICQ